MELEPWKIWLTSGVVSLSILGLASARSNIAIVGNFGNNVTRVTAVTTVNALSNANLYLQSGNTSVQDDTGYFGSGPSRSHSLFTAYFDRAFAPKSVNSILNRNFETAFTPYVAEAHSNSEDDSQIETSNGVIGTFVDIDTDISNDIASASSQLTDAWLPLNGRAQISNSYAIINFQSPEQLVSNVQASISNTVSNTVLDLDSTDIATINLAYGTNDISRSSFDGFISGDTLTGFQLDNNSGISNGYKKPDYAAMDQYGGRNNEQGMSTMVRNRYPVMAANGYSQAAIATAQLAGNGGQASDQLRIQAAAQMLLSSTPVGQQGYAQQQYAQQQYAQQQNAQQQYVQQNYQNQAAAQQEHAYQQVNGYNTVNAVNFGDGNGKRIILSTPSNVDFGINNPTGRFLQNNYW